MQRIRHQQKEENKLFFIIGIVILIVLIVILINNKRKKNTVSAENQNNIEINDETDNEFENSISEEIINEIEKAMQNKLEEENAIANITDNKKTSSNKTTPGITDKKQEAIELVKKEWGEDSSVNFAFDYVNEKGEYVIAVKDNVTATVKNYFKVNLTTKKVEVDY